MVRLFLGLLAGAVLAIAGPSAARAEESRLSAGDEALYREAFEAVDARDWRKAATLAAKAEHPLLAKVILWLDLTREDSRASFEDLSRFLEDNPAWPGARRLREHVERTMPVGLAAAEVVAWFERHSPVTREGHIRLAKAWQRLGKIEEATALLRRVWIEKDFPKPQARAFYKTYKKILRPEDHVARLDRLLWDERTDAARRMLAVVDPGHRALGEARLKLMELSPGVDAAIAAVPEELIGDPGLAYERLRWRRLKRFDVRAREILFAPPTELVRPAKWWRELAIQVRNALDEGHISEAYELAARHGQTEGIGFAEAEWLVGWIAFSFLREYGVALEHFTTMRSGVSFPISVARASFWAGRALEEMGDFEAAAARYAEAAQHWQTYYGQLAGARRSVIDGEGLSLELTSTINAQTDLEGHELVEVVHLLSALDQSELSDPFILSLAELGHTHADEAFVARLALTIGRPDLAVAVGRRATQKGFTLTPYGYPLVSLPIDPQASGLEEALVLAVVRQESAFDSKAISRAGARGLMQLIPATAGQVARALGVSNSTAELTLNPAYNLRLGTTYLAGLIDAFEGSYILALAAYNAGPRNVKEWIRRYGDPRDQDVDIIDWIELIPFAETRNYVQRVLEGLQLYRSLLGERYAAPMLIHDLNRGRKAAVPVQG